MKITIKEELARVIGPKDLKPFGVDFDNFRWRGTKGIDIDLARFSVMKALELKGLVAECLEVKGARSMVKDIDAWVASTKGAGQAKPRNPNQFTSMLKQTFRRAAGHRVYEKDGENDTWWPYYVEDIEYVAPTKYNQAHCNIELYYYEFGAIFSRTISFYMKDLRGRTVAEALAAKDMSPETPELRERYLADKTVYLGAVDGIGTQYWARGFAMDNLDGNADEDEDTHWWKRTHVIRLDRNDELSRVVMDVFQENDKQVERSSYGDEREDEPPTGGFWQRELAKRANDKGDIPEDDDIELDDEDEDQLEVPIHFTVATFDLRKHLRLRMHVSQLTKYEYDPKLGDKLVLPSDSRALIDILLAQGGNEFKDVISGKGAGAVILSAGPPGTGKTLTAEAYAEVTSRPLYTVQCSQLGTDADELEANLLKSFERADRWNAILLLDEADVYVAKRGTDLTQNAIVGVFLRTLEYYKGTMFMTTNRADLVDDAVLSRCIARIEYALPTVGDQRKIWRILADNAGIELKDAVIKQIVDKNDKLSGRDIKNLLKLAQLIGAARKEPINADLIQFVKRYKPTGDIE